MIRKLGYGLPLAVKRGYHMHYRAAGHAKLNHPVLDHERGYFMVPMRKGIRLTTGAEFAHRDAIRTPVQLGRAEPIGRDLVAERARYAVGGQPCGVRLVPAEREVGEYFAVAARRFGHGVRHGHVTPRTLVLDLGFL